MENPEEVLQALDEFQKMRPSEIPRELEDYLCWVAKTGDPVYQWSLVKALFREKLTRVMTEFYESCPTLDLTPCPNVEQFNYDTMKSTLLERLESFVNAPFTVQRICELLTTPRKEYNRIDKFMRAIEKNILVVSTREPGGNFGRRSENGDNMVNGSVEDETSHHGQTSNEVDMENWVKDCTATTAAPVHTGNSEEIPSDGENGSGRPLKISFGTKQERIELTPVDTTASSFVTNTGDFSPVTVLPAQVPIHETATVVQNLATINHETAAIVGDVSDAIMNEDTSSQPSLELESDDNDSSDSKKLQTTFQAKDFSLDEDKVPKTYAEALQSDKPEENNITTELSKDCEQLIESAYSSEKQSNESAADLQSADKTDDLDAHSIISETNQDEEKIVTELQSSESESGSESQISEDSVPSTTDKLDEKNETEEGAADSFTALSEPKCDTEVKEEVHSEPVKEDIPDETELSENIVKESTEKVAVEVEASLDVGKSIIEEPVLETPDSSNSSEIVNPELTIEETTEDNTKTIKTLVPDPIPIIEEPKDTESVAKEWENTVSVLEVTSDSKVVETASTVKNGIDESEVKSDLIEDNQMIVTNCEETPINKGTTESMDVDNEALIPSVQQDEPMEQETTEAMNS